MRIRSLLSGVCVATCIVGAVGVYQLYGSQPEKEHEERAEVFTRESSKNEEDAVARAARLGTELNAVKAQLAAIKTHLATRAPASEERAQVEEAPSVSPEEQRADEALAWKQHMAKVADAFDAEAIDPNWASITSETVESAIKADPVIAAAAGDVQCRSKTCRIEVTKDEAGEVDKQLPAFVHGLGETLPFGQADRIENSDGTTTLALYLGMETPPAPERVAR